MFSPLSPSWVTDRPSLSTRRRDTMSSPVTGDRASTSRSLTFCSTPLGSSWNRSRVVSGSGARGPRCCSVSTTMRCASSMSGGSTCSPSSLVSPAG